jgi:tetratricopeptide (TPR) repeat protein
MDSLITAAARALAAGDPLNRVGLRDDAPALALRGIAMAQLGDLDQAKALAARATLEQYGDRVNAAHARYLEVRRLLLIGRLADAKRMLAEFDPAPFPPASRTAHELVVAGSRCDASGRRRRTPGSLKPSL